MNHNFIRHFIFKNLVLFRFGIWGFLLFLRVFRLLTVELILIAKISTRIDSWLVRHLSFAGMLQLIFLVLFSLQVFWARVIILRIRNENRENLRIGIVFDR
jgi:hypothetical protein